MFSRKSTNSLSKDSGTAPPLDATAPTVALVSVLNSGLSFALMEERTCAALLHKLSSSHLQAMKHLMQWANSQKSPLFAVIYAKVAEVSWMWSQIIKETADKYTEYIKLLHEVFSEERAIEEVHKAAGIAQQHVSRAQKNLDASRRKSDTTKQAALQKDVETARENYDMLSQKLLQQLSSVEVLQLKNVRRGLTAQSSSYLTMAEQCQKLFTTQQSLVDMIPTDHTQLMDEDVIKGIECSMNECLFGLAEDLDLWPPEGGGVLAPDGGGHPEQNGHDHKLSTTFVSSTQPNEADMKPAALSSSQEAFAVPMPPALPPRSPMANRKTEKLKGGDSEGDIRSRCKSLSIHDRKGKKSGPKKQETMPEPPAKEDCATAESHYETIDNEELRGWAKLWKRNRRPNSAYFALKPDAYDRLLPLGVQPGHYGSDPNLLSSVVSEMEACPDSHYVINTGVSPPNGTGELQTESHSTDVRQEEDPYSDPIDALANYDPQYMLYRRTPDAYPILVRVGESPQPLGALRKMRRHNSADNIFADVEEEEEELGEEMYSVPFDVLLHRQGAERPPGGDRRVRVVGQRQRYSRALTDGEVGQHKAKTPGEVRRNMPPSRSLSWKEGSQRDRRFRPRSRPVLTLEAEAVRGAVERKKHISYNLEYSTQRSPDMPHPLTPITDTTPDSTTQHALVENHEYCQIDTLSEAELEGAGRQQSDRVEITILEDGLSEEREVGERKNQDFPVPLKVCKVSSAQAKLVTLRQ